MLFLTLITDEVDLFGEAFYDIFIIFLYVNVKLQTNKIKLLLLVGKVRLNIYHNCPWNTVRKYFPYTTQLVVQQGLLTRVSEASL